MALSFPSPMASGFPVPVHVPSARIQLAFENMKTDAIHPIRGASVDDIQNHLDSRTNSTFIASLWDATSNNDLVSEFLNNSFCGFCARSTDDECLPVFRKYAVQDYFYLEDYAYYKANRLITFPPGNLTALKTEADSVANDTGYAIDAGQSYVNDLHGKAADLAEENRSIEELAYGNLLQNAASHEDWFNMHVLSIPCIYGWTVLAATLANDTSTKNDTLFYKYWIEANNYPSYADSLAAFLDANYEKWGNQIDQGTNDAPGAWTSLFRTALRLEIALFGSACNAGACK